MTIDFFEQACSVVDRPQANTVPNVTRPFWLTSPPLFDDARRIVRGGMFEHQAAFWNLPTFIKTLVGGYGSGKTNIGCKRIISLALENAPCPVATVSPTFPIARQTVIVTLQELLNGKQSIYGPRTFWWKYHPTFHEFTIQFHGRVAKIIVYSGDNPLSLRGPNLAAFWIDEPFIQEYAVFEQMQARVRHPDASVLEILMTGTPEQLNWGYDLCEGDLRKRLDVGWVQASTRKNLALDPGYVSRLENALPQKAALAYIEGAFVNLSQGCVYYAFDPQENVVDLSRPPGAELGVGMDFNVNPMAAAVFWRQGQHIHYFEEIELPNSDTQYMCQHLRERFGSSLQEVYPDASGKQRHTNAPGGKSDYTFIRQAGFTVNAREENPPRKDRYNAVNGKLRPKSGGITLTIAPNCRKLTKYLMAYSHELMNRPNQAAMSHLLDAFSYPVAYLFPIDKEALAVFKLKGV